jgi:cell shape-determining protein MreC
VIVAQATETAGAAAIVTAVSGVIVSLGSVWANSRKQGTATREAEDRSIVRAEELQAEVERLRSELEQLRRQLQNAEEARIERDRLMDLCQAYGGRRLRQRLIDVDLRK